MQPFRRHPSRTHCRTRHDRDLRETYLRTKHPWAPTERQRADFLEILKKSRGQPVGLEERAPSVAGDPQFREWWATYLRMGASPGAAVALTQMNAEIDVRNVLPSIRVPTLVIHRKGDECLKVEEGRYVAARIPGAKYVELEGRDHLPFVGDQDAILDEVEEFLTGARPERLIDRVLTTILFVLFDDDDSSASLQQRAEVKELQRNCVRRDLTMFKGREIEMTDAPFFATFDGPARGIRCALAITDSVARLGLRVRAGLHTGECDVFGEQIGGGTVQFGEAVAQLAGSGEVLISQTVKDLVAGSGIQLEARAAQTFAALPSEWQCSPSAA